MGFGDFIGAAISPFKNVITDKLLGGDEAKAAARVQKTSIEKARAETNAVARQQYANRMAALDRVMQMYAPVNQKFAQMGLTGYDNAPGMPGYQPFSTGQPAPQSLSALDLVGIGNTAIDNQDAQALSPIDLINKQIANYNAKNKQG